MQQAEIISPKLPAISDLPTVAVAFGGGGARGLAHIHIIETLDELGIRPVAISGSSMGAIMGAGMAAGMSGAEIREHALTTVGNKTAVVARIWGLRPATVRDAVAKGIRIGQFNLERILKAFLPAELPARFEDLLVPMKVITTDYYGQNEVIIEEGELFPALAASSAIPAVFMPVRLRGRVMIDGGISNPVPYEPLMDLADIVIGIDVVGAPEGDGTHIPNRMESIFGSGQLMMQTAITLKLKLCQPHIFLRPAVGRTGVMDFLKAREVLAMSVGVKDELKFALDREIEARLKR
ncbi:MULTISPECIES: patatin-like phospholipase family protein [Rhizobium]|uniref:patatin-like phospholipase family protein n=1 Tax=Rhizobium TaxID=379 RepID=UPI000BE996D2|nr:MULTISPECIES: patatin-like phospholipase family protein [Rhizobium]MBY4591437.1 patatin-like phospholipase family protein [Rhizobium redzepovicii]MBY4615642.1 patatin-like phospholipase family protein [Rhizobium redzepovicii]MDF0658191.1 patatin-like phospholipase family protein [Rhizobium sp. BC49]PDS87983.1 Patatin [Rhizobium sp. L18]TBY47154.1 patatin-like phospholipase family protein [Rhizobium leguminosarum bv. viciae]